MHKINLKSFISGFLVCSILTFTLPVFANGISKSVKILLNSVTVKIDGKNVGGDRINYNGNVFVNAKNVAMVLGKQYLADKNGNVTISNIQNIQKGNAFGSIKGAITWQYNDFVGTKADTGAKIALIPTNLKKGSHSYFVLTLNADKNENKSNIFSSKANGYGNYEITNIPVGEYYILISSENTNSDMTVNNWDSDRLKLIFSSEDYSKLELLLKLHKYKLDTVEILKNQTIDYSFDFGNTYF